MDAILHRIFSTFNLSQSRWGPEKRRLFIKTLQERYLMTAKSANLHQPSLGKTEEMDRLTTGEPPSAFSP